MNRKLILLLVVIALAIPATLLFQDQIRALLLIPLAHLFWLVTVYIGNIPQALFWITLLLIVFVIAFKSILLSRKPQIPMERAAPMRRMGPVESWAEWLRQTDRGTYYQERLARRLTEVALSILGYRHRLSRTAVKEGILADKLDLPPNVSNYLKQGFERNPWRLFYDPFLRIPFLQRRGTGPNLEKGALELIDYLEHDYQKGAER